MCVSVAHYYKNWRLCHYPREAESSFCRPLLSIYQRLSGYWQQEEDRNVSKLIFISIWVSSRLYQVEGVVPAWERGVFFRSRCSLHRKRLVSLTRKGFPCLGSGQEGPTKGEQRLPSDSKPIGREGET